MHYLFLLVNKNVAKCILILYIMLRLNALKKKPNIHYLVKNKDENKYIPILEPRKKKNYD